MTVLMDNSSAPSTRELAQRLLNKNIELENGLRMAAKSKIPSDPNAWMQMRENYEAIMLEDHDFSEMHEIEYALWQLHYRRIEEFRAHINTSASIAPSQSGRARPERIKKIRSIFKSFLSEATGFYHDLILKIRAKYGLPLCYFSENPEHQMIFENDVKKSVDIKKGLLSCHRCLIYLGDLSRYKGLYGEASDSIARDYAAASSYYLQASSIWPSSGNPHHQLAILASYSGDEVVAIYRYFRSLSVDNPFSTARDNLIIAFEKNRQSYSQLQIDLKCLTKVPPRSGRGRYKNDARKDNNRVDISVKDQHRAFKTFCVRFIRLNGILFTRTSLETFGDIFSLVMNEIRDLLSSGTSDHLIFGSDAIENSLFMLRIVAILIFTVHNVSKESEGQSYAEILQRSVLLENAYTATFEIAGYIFKRCSELQDSLSSYLLPATLVFIEWLACWPDIAAGSGIDDKQATVRSCFWTHCLSLLNKLISNESISLEGDADDICFSGMSKYEEGETANRLALWEDIELRGFQPLHAAHIILDFSGKCTSTDESSSKLKKARAERILAAGRALINVIWINQQHAYYDQKFKKFCVGEPPKLEADFATFSSISNDILRKEPSKTDVRTWGVSQPLEVRSHTEGGEDEDEVIVFRPSALDILTDAGASKLVGASSIWSGYDILTSGRTSGMQMTDITANGMSPSASSVTMGSSIPGSDDHSFTKWQEEQFIGDLGSLSISGNEITTVKPARFWEADKTSDRLTMPVNYNHIVPISMDTVAEPASISHVLSGTMMGVSAASTGLSVIENPKKNPIGRPVSRYFGPPPGFNAVPPSKKLNDFSIGSAWKNDQELLLLDDYRWLDEYHSPQEKSKKISSKKAENSICNGGTTASMVNFLFPVGQSSPDDLIAKQKIWQCNDLKYQNVFMEQKLPQVHEKTGSQLVDQSLWSSQFYV